MEIIFNAGSENRGGTFEQAEKYAKELLDYIHNEGFLEVEMKFIEQLKNGNYLFHFIHSITKKIATYETHGFTKEEWKKFTFPPREYWNDSSTGSPEIKDWLADGFKYRIEYYMEK